MSTSAVDVWREWSEKFIHLKQYPMTDELAHAFMACSFGDTDPTFPPESVKELFQWKIVEQRAKWCGLQLSNGALAFLASLVTSPGDAVMYVMALKYVQVKRGLSVVTLSNITDVFPMGFPSKEALSEVWDYQKGHVHGLKLDNVLDHVASSDMVA